MPPRIPLTDPEEVPPDVKAVFDRFMKVRGNIPNMFRTVARRPEIMLTMEAHMNAVFNKGTVEFALKEMCAVRTSANNKCAY
ncbi:MAG: carboxymuconolactone decarboxylase family protein [Chloroflexota bacterium]|nr:carboxymuconolactone decarboxylase family protein [Chloroflexota bacterium]